MKLIFLDVNGVLNNDELKAKLRRKGVTDIDKHYDNKSLDYLKDLVSVSDAKIILTSEIRKKGHKSPEYKNLKNKLASKGLSIYDEIDTNVDIPVIGVSKYINYIQMSGTRVEAYVILDDDPTNAPDKHYVLTRSGNDSKDGFTRKHLMEAMKILMGEDYIHVEGGQI